MGTEKLTEAQVRGWLALAAKLEEPAWGGSHWKAVHEIYTTALPRLAARWLAQREALARLAWHYHAMHLGCDDDDVPGEFAWEECTEEHCSLIRAALGEEATHE